MRGTESDDHAVMCKPDPNPQNPHRCGPFVLGRERFARVSAVEGIALTDEIRATFDRFDHQGLSAEERRRAIHQCFSEAPFPEVNLAEAIHRR